MMRLARSGFPFGEAVTRGVGGFDGDMAALVTAKFRLENRGRRKRIVKRGGVVLLEPHAAHLDDWRAVF